jgi:hypothetical protein
MNTFDADGHLLGDDASSAPVGTPDNPLQLDTMTVTAAPPSFFDSLLQPPLVYFLVIGIGIAAYLYERER